MTPGMRENRHHLTIDKLTRNQPITASELEALEQILFTEDVAGSQEQLNRSTAKCRWENSFGAFSDWTFR